MNGNSFKQTEIDLIPEDWKVMRLELYTMFERVDEPSFKFTELQEERKKTEREKIEKILKW